ncbi:guanylate kinase [Dietzia kunjamensis]|jgi:guanylate kinase|uniref:Guanylate kinase n=2 Tax=Dietzia maris TaxID=37915 RepID=A0A365P8E6_9ACTN|nr:MULTISPECIES: guanylate kinase [Dietzia]MBB0989899.1 guanylate kinase [Dietzia sp. SLG510A3-30A2]MBB0993644.1 guanylate kinase [Dietzia sp. SLG510A3-40A3]MBB1009650.1 guanylate kinase [Dietzia sp. SLG510A3-3B2-2]MVZ89443.1 guanylate kinase [Microbacter sp. ANSKLAB05]MBB1013471.1 guanylate kinase [Dietzia kunjamensis]
MNTPSSGVTPETTAKRGRLIVLAGPSAVGKSTVVARLRECVPDLYFSVSMTTRDPRPGEVDGRDYYFVSTEDFRKAVSEGRMLEWAEIHRGLQLSGTPADPVHRALEAGRPVLIEVDLAGVRQIRESIPEGRTVFLAPPSWEELEVRLRGRGTEPQDVVDRRLETAKVEMEARGEFDEVVVNDELEKAVDELVSLLVGRD